MIARAGVCAETSFDDVQSRNPHSPRSAKVSRTPQACSHRIRHPLLWYIRFGPWSALQRWTRGGTTPRYCNAGVFPAIFTKPLVSKSTQCRACFEGPQCRVLSGFEDHTMSCLLRGPTVPGPLSGFEGPIMPLACRSSASSELLINACQLERDKNIPILHLHLRVLGSRLDLKGNAHDRCFWHLASERNSALGVCQALDGPVTSSSSPAPTPAESPMMRL
jgi:hypothetical protein